MPEGSNPAQSCRVYWGSHGCRLPRGHKDHHECVCARDDHGNLEPREDEDGYLNVGAHPYYGRITRFYGEDVSSWQRLLWHIKGWWLEARLVSDRQGGPR